MRDKNRERRRELLAIDAANIQLYRIYVYSQSIYC